MVDAFGHSKNSDDFCLEVDKIDYIYPMSFYFSFKSDHLSELQEIVI